MRKLKMDEKNKNEVILEDNEEKNVEIDAVEKEEAEVKEPGCIIELTGREFLEVFALNEDYRDFQFLVISTDISSAEEFKNVTVMKNLIPTSWIIQEHLSDNKKNYKRLYEEFLDRPENRFMITTMIKTIFEHNFKLILLYSDEESEYYYIKLIRKYIEKYYGVPTYNYKEFLDARKNDQWKVCKDPKSTLEQVNKEIEYVMALERNKSKDNLSKMDKAVKTLQDMKFKQLKEFCKEKGYKKYKKYETKDELIEYIIKKLEKEA